ncbi:FAD:protein FMN transferase [Rhodococcus sp. TAF43]|uniref:FAD:protein FMN transferase n=1 Tax=unclassified Rhodococcus (in: high G+C Gram-positive bacteria) TaxID=192944 RepID=UPI000E0AA168|nr:MULTISPECIES: FAD:protein FMN transferase [unclassified Rhodococcus (in: high G+C Gram-positive bacteria)]QKT10484.1 FAD:protein FMN transferase [Rhodococcus sp. W8901]RDI35614.1 thiamine biosynthesis lipoprotein [Rhodococcus sp. AG1013]
MLVDTRWSAWNEEIEVQVTEAAALGPAAGLVGAVLSEAESACSLHRGDAEIHAVNLAQGLPVRVSVRLAGLLRSALWVARMTDGVVSPLAFDEPPSSVPSIHPEPTFADVQIDDATVLAPWGVSFDIGDTAKADTADRAAALVAHELECGVLVRVGGNVATAGHCPAGGWQVPVPGDGAVELPAGTALATAGADRTRASEGVGGGWEQVSVMAGDALWAYAAAASSQRRNLGAVAWLEQQELAARLVDYDGRVYTTCGWSHPHAA